MSDGSPDQGFAPDVVQWQPNHRPGWRGGALAPLTSTALAVGALAIGALALGGLVMGGVAIGWLGVGRARVRVLEVERLDVGHIGRLVD